jgi:hypothetical protein
MIARLLIAPLVVAMLRRRLRRAGGTDGLAWAARLPLVTLPALALLLAIALTPRTPRKPAPSPSGSSPRPMSARVPLRSASHGAPGSAS